MCNISRLNALYTNINNKHEHFLMKLFKEKKTNLLGIITNLHALIALNILNCCKNKIKTLKYFIITIRNFGLPIKNDKLIYILHFVCVISVMGKVI